MVARIALIVLAGVGLGGCYASTEPATEVGGSSAKLNARGTANNGPADSWFQYWITGTTNRVQYSDTLRFPVGASGPYSTGVTGLAASTQYSFRACGADRPNGNAGCAQTRTFSTGPAVEDAVVGSWRHGTAFTGSIDARSGPSGQNPQGSISRFDGTPSSPNNPSRFTGFVTCLAVQGNRAAVGAVGQESNDSTTSHPATLLATVVDNRPTGIDTLGLRLQPGSTPPNCATASFDHQQNLEYIGTPDEVVVNDAP